MPMILGVCVPGRLTREGHRERLALRSLQERSLFRVLCVERRIATNGLCCEELIRGVPSIAVYPSSAAALHESLFFFLSVRRRSGRPVRLWSERTCRTTEHPLHLR